jgi:hypothetical protein
MLSTYALVRSVLFVQPAWPFATLTLYLERRCEGAKDPHGSFARLHAAPVQQRLRRRVLWRCITRLHHLVARIWTVQRSCPRTRLFMVSLRLLIAWLCITGLLHPVARPRIMRLSLLMTRHRTTRRCHAIALSIHMRRPLRTVISRRSLVRGSRSSPHLPELESPPPKHHAARESGDQAQGSDNSSNNNEGLVLHVETLEAKRIGVLEFELAADNLTLWRWVLWVVTVLFETVRANIRSRSDGVGLQPCTVDGSTLETCSECRISTQPTYQESIGCGRSCLAQELGSVPRRISKLEGPRTEE